MTNELLMLCKALCGVFKGLDEGAATACLCMCMDQVAHDRGQTTIEMLDELRPAIEQVHDQFGDEGLM